MSVCVLAADPFPSCECGRVLIHRQSFALYSSMSAEGERPGTFGTEEEEEEEGGGTLALFGRGGREGGSGVMAAAFVKAEGMEWGRFWPSTPLVAFRKRQTGHCHALRRKGHLPQSIFPAFKHKKVLLHSEL